MLAAQIAVDRVHHVVYRKETLGAATQPLVVISERRRQRGRECPLLGFLFRPRCCDNEDRGSTAENRSKAVRDPCEFGRSRARIAGI